MTTALPPLDRRFTLAWTFVLLLGLLAELVAPRGVIFDGAFALAVGLEVIGAIRPGAGDTLSEQLFHWQTDDEAGWRWARAFAVAGIALWISIRFYQFGPGGDAGRAALAGGLCGWLLLHWLLRGRYG